MPPGSSLPPVETIRSTPSGSGRCSVVPRRAHPDIVFLERRQDDRHRLRMNVGDFHIRLAGQETE
jgi:hypothetical protein